jgi:hypothetical protein
MQSLHRLLISFKELRMFAADFFVTTAPFARKLMCIGYCDVRKGRAFVWYHHLSIRDVINVMVWILNGFYDAQWSTVHGYLCAAAREQMFDWLVHRIVPR